MIEFYGSEDFGLLEEKANIFISKYKNPSILKYPNLNELRSELLQCTLEEEKNAYLVGDYSDKLDTLIEIFSMDLIKDKSLLFLANSNTVLNIPPELQLFLENKKFKINRLSSRSKKKYISNKIEDLKLSLSPNTFEYLVKYLPHDASEINNFFKLLDLYIDKKTLDIEDLEKLLNFVHLKVDNFLFGREYLEKNIITWMNYLESNSSSFDEFKSLISAFSFKLLEFKNFLELQNNNLRLSEISKVLNREVFYLKEYEEVASKFNEERRNGLNEFVVELFFFLSFLMKDFFHKFSLLRYFLIKNNI